AGLTPGQPSYQTSTSVPAGVVISTNPAAYQHWPRTKPVALVVSSGVPLPNFVGGPVDAALSAAASGGFSISQEQDTTSSQPPGTVTRQSPAANTPLTQGEVVTVWVSQPQQVNIPDVQGMDTDQATQALEQAGFQVNQVGSGSKVLTYSPQGQAPQGA